MPEPVAGEFRYGSRPQRVLFLSRPNRFRAEVRILPDGPTVGAHVPNPGRMEELLLPRRTVGWAVPADRAGRKTRLDLVVVRHRGALVSIDSRVANRLVGGLLAAGRLPEFGPGPWRAEVRWGRSRLDFAAGDPGGPTTALLEVKSSNLRIGRAAAFPDAPTLRGTRHLGELLRARSAGLPAGVLFAVQRDDVEEFRPNAALDPDFARALVAAAQAGVTVRAAALAVEPGRVRWRRPLPVRLAVERVRPKDNISGRGRMN